MERLKSFGINFVYTHNYDCEPGSHLSFEEILRAADDVGMLVSFTQPHFSHYDWKAADADRNQRLRASTPSSTSAWLRIIRRSSSTRMSHNATGYSEDMNPDMIDGLTDPRDTWSRNNARLALRAEAIVKRLDPTRIVYHHAVGQPRLDAHEQLLPQLRSRSRSFPTGSSTGRPGRQAGLHVRVRRAVHLGLGDVPRLVQGRSGHSAAPGSRGSSASPSGTPSSSATRAFQISEMEKTNLRWEARQFRAGELWHRWDYPYESARSSSTNATR